jgi:hypothetical protein
MARSGRFGLNPKKTYGTSQSITNVVPGKVYSDNRGDWLCIVASGAITQYDAVLFDPTSATFTAASVTYATAGSGTGKRYTVGIAQWALATGETGLVWIGGGAAGGQGSGIKVRVAASFAAGAPMYTTGTAGVLDDTTTTQTLIPNLVGLTTDSGAGSAIEVYSHDHLYIN